MGAPPPRPLRVLCCISSLEGGGAERVMATLANEFTALGSAVEVVTFLPISGREYRLDAAVARHSLEVGTGEPSVVASMFRNLTRIRRLAAAIRRFDADVVLAFMESPNIASIIAARLTKRAVVVSERVDPRTYRLARPWAILRRRCYPFADAVVLQTAGVADGWARAFLRPERVHVLPNPLSVPVTASPVPLQAREPVLLAAGRLDRQKGFDVLIDAFARIAPSLDPTMRLEIAGEGPDRAALDARIAERGLTHRAAMLGRVSDLPARMARARAFVLSSRFEGFPNVMLEALAMGTPVAATDCLSGPREILGDSIAGVLAPVDDVAAIGDAITQVTDPSRYAARIAAAPVVAQRYTGPSIAAQWHALLRRVAR